MIDEHFLSQIQKETNKFLDMTRDKEDMQVNPFLMFEGYASKELLESLYLLFSDEMYDQAAKNCAKTLITHAAQVDPSLVLRYIEKFNEQNESDSNRLIILQLLQIAISNVSAEIELPIPISFMETLFNYIPNDVVIETICQLNGRDIFWAQCFMQCIAKSILQQTGDPLKNSSILNNGNKNIYYLFFLELMKTNFGDSLKLLRSVTQYKENAIFFVPILTEIISIISSCSNYDKVECFKTISCFFEGDDLFLQHLFEHEDIQNVFLLIEKETRPVVCAALKFANEVTQSSERDSFKFLKLTNFCKIMKELMDSMDQSCFEICCKIGERVVRSKKAKGVSFLLEDEGFLPALYLFKDSFNYKVLQKYLHFAMLCVEKGTKTQIYEILSFIYLEEICNYANSLDKEDSIFFLKKIATTILNYESNGTKYYIDEDSLNLIKSIAESEDKENNQLTEFLSLLSPLFVSLE